jgi:transposase-like protein
MDWLREHLDADGSDLMKEMVRTFAQALMSAEADALCGAPMARCRSTG